MAYEIGDEVRVWAVFKHPTGSVVDITSDGKYVIEYRYHTGEFYIETYEAKDLALVQKRNRGCTCGLMHAPSGGMHDQDCVYAGVIEHGIHDEKYKLKS